MMDRGYRMSEIARVTGGALSLDLGDHHIRHLAIDTRGATPDEGTLFIALRGQRHDGHRYINDMAARGVRDVLMNADSNADEQELNTIAVPDTLAALQTLAAHHRGHFSYPVIGITGSNGKTVVKEWLYQCLSSTERIVRSPGSWNSQVGVPLSVWEMGTEHTLGIFEAGISRPGEMAKLAAVVKPTVGIFTNLGAAHASGFADEQEKAGEKATLFIGADTVVHCADHAEVRSALLKAGVPATALAHDWARKREAWVVLEKESPVDQGLELQVRWNDARHRFRLPFTDAASVENAMQVITVLLHLGHAPTWIAERIERLEPVAMRLEMVAAIGGGVLVNDAYSSDPTSFALALDHLVRHGEGRPRIAVVGDIQGSGIPDERLYAQVAAQLRDARVQHIIAVGPAITAQRTAFPANTAFFHDADALLLDHPVPPVPGAIVLVKGARALGLERIVDHWQERSHGTVLEIDLGAVRDNLNHYRAVIGPQVKVMAMVKADAYGMGAVALARLFAHERVAYLGAAYVDEGVELRRKGIHLPVLVMNPQPMPFELLHRHRLETEVYDERSLQDAIAFAERTPDAPPVHIEVDTGMCRLGFSLQELPRLHELLREGKALRVASIMSHLAGADNPQHDAFTRQQIQTFHQSAAGISDVLGYTPLRHIANSVGAARFPEARMDLVRLGIGLHGVATAPEDREALRPVATLRTVIAQVRSIAPGTSVSYDRTFLAQRPTRIAVLPIGYADGLSRRLGNGRGKAWVGGKAAPFAGIICMDMCMVDITDTGGAVGDAVEIFGPAHPVQEYANDLGTIPYEALTSISPRVRRIHVRG